MRRSQLFLDLVTIRLECTCLSLRAGVAKGRVFLSRGICSDSPCTSSSGFLCMVCPGCALPEAETQRCHLGLLSPPSSGQGQAEGPPQAEAQKGLQTRLAGGGGVTDPFPLRSYFSSSTWHGRGSGTGCSAPPLATSWQLDGPLCWGRCPLLSPLWSVHSLLPLSY